MSPPESSPPPPPSTVGPTLGLLPRPVRLARYLVTGALLAGMIGVVLFTYRIIEAEIQSTLEQRLVAVLTTNTQVTEQWFEERRELALGITQSPEFVQMLEQWTAGLGVLAEPDEATVTRFVAPLAPIDGYAFFDVNGRLAFGGGSGDTLGAHLGVDDFERAAREGASSSVIPGTSKDPGARLILLARVRPLGSLLGYWAVEVPLDHPARGLKTAVWGKSGRSFAFDRDGVVLSAEAPDRNVSAELLETARARAPEIVLDGDGALVKRDRVGAFRWLPGRGIGVATVVERDEAYESVSVLKRAFSVLIVLIGAALLGFVALGRWTLKMRQESLLANQRLGRLARAIQPLSAVLEHDPGAVVLIDDAGTVVYANSATHEILGVDGPLTGKSAFELFDELHPELRDAVISGLEAIVAQKPGQEDETLLVTSRPLRIEGRLHYVYTLRPVTREVRRKELEHWKKLIRVLSHELNNSLAPIVSLVNSGKKLNEQNYHDETLRKVLDAIAERTTHLVSFLESYRSIARLPRPAPRLVDWTSFLEGLKSQKGFRVEGELPQRPGYFDPIQLERVVINAVDNSIEAGSPPEDIEVRVEETDDGARLEILDRGSGMTEPVLKQAMLPFFSTKRSGTGVGLALSREIVEGHGGQMTLANREGGGLVVSLLLPGPSPLPEGPTSSGRWLTVPER